MKKIFLTLCCIGAPLLKGVALSVEHDITPETDIITEALDHIDYYRQRIDSLEATFRQESPNNLLVYHIMTQTADIAHSLHDISMSISQNVLPAYQTELEQLIDQQHDRLLALTSNLTRTLALQISTLVLRSRNLAQDDKNLLILKYFEIVACHQALDDLFSSLNPALGCYLHWCILLDHIDTIKSTLGL